MDRKEADGLDRMLELLLRRMKRRMVDGGMCGVISDTGTSSQLMTTIRLEERPI